LETQARGEITENQREEATEKTQQAQETENSSPSFSPSGQLAENAQTPPADTSFTENPALAESTITSNPTFGDNKFDFPDASPASDFQEEIGQLFDALV